MKNNFHGKLVLITGGLGFIGSALIKKLSNVGVGTGIHYQCPIHLMSGYEFLGYSEESLPVTELLSGELLSLPMYPELTKEEVAFVCEQLNRILS